MYGIVWHDQTPDKVKGRKSAEWPLLTVGVSKHDAGALAPELQGHPLQVAHPSGLFDHFANLKWNITKEEA